LVVLRSNYVIVIREFLGKQLSIADVPAKDKERLHLPNHNASVQVSKKFLSLVPFHGSYCLSFVESDYLSNDAPLISTNNVEEQNPGGKITYLARIDTETGEVNPLLRLLVPKAVEFETPYAPRIATFGNRSIAIRYDDSIILLVPTTTRQRARHVEVER
jgi:hypothetical protein